MKKLEKENEFKRDRFAQIQFKEEWLFDEKDFRMEKRITSIILGYELYDSNHRVKGYTAAFKVYLNK